MERIDVLAVMSRVSRERNGIPELDEARAALNELVVRAKNAAGALDIAIEYNGQIRDTSALAFERDQLRAALTNIGASA